MQEQGMSHTHVRGTLVVEMSRSCSSEVRRVWVAAPRRGTFCSDAVQYP